MKRLTPAQRFRFEEAKQNLRGWARALLSIVLLAAALIYLEPYVQRQEAEWQRLPLQTAIGQVERIHAPTPDDHPGAGHATMTGMTLVWDTPRGRVKGEAHSNNVVALGQHFRVHYQQHPSGDVRILRLAPVDVSHHGRR